MPKNMSIETKIIFCVVEHLCVVFLVRTYFEVLRGVFCLHASTKHIDFSELV